MGELVGVLAVVAALAIGVLLGFLARGLWASQAFRMAQEKAGRIISDARAQQKELILQAKEETLRLQREADDEGRGRRTELAALERRLLERDEQLDQRTEMLEAPALPRLAPGMLVGDRSGPGLRLVNDVITEMVPGGEEAVDAMHVALIGRSGRWITRSRLVGGR